MITQKEQQRDIEIPRICYLQIRGLAEPIRNLFYVLDVQYTEANQQSIDQENLWKQQLFFTFNSGNFPKLIHGDIRISETISICRYLCQKFSRQQLLGLTPQIQAQVNSILSKYSMQMGKMMPLIFKGVQDISKQPKKKLQIQWRMFKQILEQSNYIQACLKLYNQSKSFLVGDITIIDLFFYQACFYICNFFNNIITFHPSFHQFKQFKDFIQSQSFYIKNKDKIQSRKIFLPIKSQKIRRIILSLWNDPSSILFDMKNDL